MPDYTPTSHAPLPRDPYEGLTKLPEFTLTSTDITDGGTAPTTMLSALFGVPPGRTFPRSCRGAASPADTQSFVITCYDPDAPTPSGSGTGPYQTSRLLLPLLRRAQPHRTVRSPTAMTPVFPGFGCGTSGGARAAPVHFLRDRRGRTRT